MATVKTAGGEYTLTDRSGTITAGGTAQDLAAAMTNRHGLSVQNLSSADIYIRFTGTASAGSGSIRIPAGALYEAPLTGVPAGAISVYGATTGQTFTAMEW